MAIFILSADVSFVNFNFAHELSKSVVLHRSADSVAHIPGRPVVTAADLPVNLKRANSLLALSHRVNDLEPSPKGIVGVLKNGMSNNRESIAVFATAILVFADPVKWACLQLIYLFAIAARAMNPIRPAQGFKVGFAGFLSREAHHKLGQSHAGLSGQLFCFHDANIATNRLGVKCNIITLLKGYVDDDTIGERYHP